MRDQVLMSCVVLVFGALVRVWNRISGKAPARASQLNCGRGVNSTRRGAAALAEVEVSPT
jgi:hypothetical protein